VCCLGVYWAPFLVLSCLRVIGYRLGAGINFFTASPSIFLSALLKGVRLFILSHGKAWMIFYPGGALYMNYSRELSIFIASSVYVL